METLAQTTLPPPDPTWDEAFLRVESYLRAHHIHSRALLNRLTTELIAETQAQATGRPAEEIVPLTMEMAQTRIGRWFAQVLGEGDWTDERFLARGRLALLLTDLPNQGPQYVFSAEPLPAEWVEAMRSCAFQAGPELRFSNMPPTPLDLILGEEEDPTHSLARPRRLQSVMWGGLLLIGALGIAWASSH